MDVDACLVWFRSDLRLADNPALTAAVATGRPVVPVFIWAPDEEGEWPPGGASRWWLHHALAALDGALRRVGNRLRIRRVASSRGSPDVAPGGIDAAPSDGHARGKVAGKQAAKGPAATTLEALENLAAEVGATAIFWNRRYEPAVIARDTRIKQALEATGLEARSFNAQLLHEPWAITTQAGEPFRVFTPFWKACLDADPPARTLPAPTRVPDQVDSGDTTEDAQGGALEQLGLLPEIDWAAGLRATWTPGEAGATRGLEAFLAEAVAHYATARDRPGEAGTSRLSPHLHFGEIGPRQIWWALHDAGASGDGELSMTGASSYLRELGWREFSHHLLFHFPHTTQAPLRPEFARFPWTRVPEQQRAWQKGQTGFPLVDAGMRELWQTGYMHNRVRMVAASFLIKDLLAPWQAGARWFWDTLVDADLAQNTLGWQWVAGSGADAAPYFRVFNPILQAQKFDPDGVYIRRFVPELSRLPTRYVHAPWLCPAAELGRAGVRLGVDYPYPILDHAAARARALAAYRTL